MIRKTAFFEGRSWFKLNNLGLALGTNLGFYTSLSKGLKLKVKKFGGLILTFVEVIGEKLIGGLSTPPPILNRVKQSPETKIGHGIAVTELETLINFSPRHSLPLFLRGKINRKYKEKSKMEISTKYCLSTQFLMTCYA